MRPEGTTFPRWFRERLARMRRDARRGSAIVEFAFVAPVFFLLLMGMIETGILFFVNATLQHAVDETARLVRTGELHGTISADDLKADICGELGSLVSSDTCKADMNLDLRAYDNFSNASFGGVTKDDGSVDPDKLQIQGVAACQVVVLRAFFAWQIMTPLMEPLLENEPGGKHLLSGAAAFRTEPYKPGQVC